MEERRPERSGRRVDASWEHDEVERVRALLVEGRTQHGEHRRIAMVEARVADRAECIEVIHVRRLIAMPARDVERRMILTRFVKLAAELRDDPEVGREAIFEPRAGRGKWRASARPLAP